MKLPTWFRKILLVSLGIFIGLAILETGLRIKYKEHGFSYYSSPENFFDWDSPIGISGLKNGHTKKLVSPSPGVLTELDYSLDQFGLRYSGEPRNLKSNLPKIVLFGDCTSFGDGVEYNQSFAGTIQQHFKDQFDVINFSFMGFSANRMRYFLELNLEQELLAGKNIKEFFYIPSVWQIYSSLPGSKEYRPPRYSLNDKGSLHFDGINSPNEWGEVILKKSLESRLMPLTYVILTQMIQWRNPPENSSINLYVELLGEINEVLKKRYGTGLTVVMSPAITLRVPGLLEKLKQKNLKFVLLNSSNPQYFKSENYLSDGHPKAIIHDQISKEITDYISSK